MAPAGRDHLDAVTCSDDYHVYWPEMYVAATEQPRDVRAVYDALGALCAHDGFRQHLTETLFVILRLDGGFDPDSDDDPRVDELNFLLHTVVDLDGRRPELLRHLRAAVQRCDAFDSCADHAKHCQPECAQRHQIHTHRDVAAGNTRHNHSQVLPPT